MGECGCSARSLHTRSLSAAARYEPATLKNPSGVVSSLRSMLFLPARSLQARRRRHDYGAPLSLWRHWHDTPTDLVPHRFAGVAISALWSLKITNPESMGRAGWRHWHDTPTDLVPHRFAGVAISVLWSLKITNPESMGRAGSCSRLFPPRSEEHT